MSRLTPRVLFMLVALHAPLVAAREPVTLDQARARALAAHPGLQAAELRVAAAEGAVAQAGRPPNPDLELEGENLGGDLPTTGAAELTLSLGQTLETGGKRRLRVAEAQAARAVRAAEVEVVRRELLFRVDQAFIAVLTAQERLVIAEEAAATAAEVAATVAAMVEAGEVSPIEATRAQAETAVAAAAATRVRSLLEAAGARLAALWAGSEQPGAAADLARVVELPAGWRERADPSALPELGRLTAESELGAAAAERLRRQAVPDLELGAGYRRLRETGDDTFVVSVGLSLPLFDRSLGAAAEAEALAAASLKDREAESAEAAAELRAARAELEQAGLEVGLVVDEVLPAAREVYQAVREGYALGEFRLLDLLEARRALAEARTRQVEALERQALARARLLRFLTPPALSAGGTP